MSNATPTRPATEADSAPLDRAYLRSPALPTRCAPVEAVPVSAASPAKRGFSVRPAGILPAVEFPTLVEARRYADSIWRPGRVIFVEGSDESGAVSMTVGSTPCDSPAIAGGES